MDRKERIELMLMDNLNPSHLEVLDESSGHNVPAGSESHFKVVAVCDNFKGVNKVSRHRMVNQLLQEEFKKGLHALSLHLYNVDEWQNQQSKGAPLSPLCQHKKKHG